VRFRDVDGEVETKKLVDEALVAERAERGRGCDGFAPQSLMQERSGCTISPQPPSLWYPPPNGGSDH
jgi:hypothetical protein